MKASGESRWRVEGSGVMSDKGTSWLCPLVFALALQFTRSYRLAVLSLIVFFAAGLTVLARIDIARGAYEAAGV